MIDEAFTATEKQLRSMIETTSEAYHNGSSSIGDDVFDKILEIYEHRFGKWTKVGAPPSKDQTKKVSLPYWLGSLDKIKKEQHKEIDRWCKAYRGSYVIQDKLDGISGLLTCVKDKLVLYTRGDGKVGVDISHILPYIRGIPKDLSLNKGEGIRGELVMKVSRFRKYKDEFKNPRNLVCGTINSKTLRQTILNDIDYIAYEFISNEDLCSSEQLLELEDMGFKTPNSLVLNQISSQILERRLDSFRDNCEYEIDGIVVTDDSTEYSHNTSGNPKHSFAFKMLTETAVTEVEYVEWNITKHRVLKPRVKVKPVDLSGTTINWTSGFNAKYIKDNGIGPKAKIELTRSGDVIPFIVRVLEKSKPQFPDVEYTWNESVIDIIGDEDEDVIVPRITNFFTTLKIKGIQKKTVERLVSVGCDTVEYILNLEVDDLKDKGFGAKESLNMYESIRVGTKNVDLATLMAATPYFGFGLGVKKIQLALNLYPNILDIKVDDKVVVNISDVDGLSMESALQFTEGLKEFKRFLRDNQSITYTIKKSNGEGKWVGKTIVFSGVRDKGLEEKIEHGGGKVSTSVSNKTSILVVKSLEDTSSKIDKARNLGVDIITIDKLFGYFN